MRVAIALACALSLPLAARADVMPPGYRAAPAPPRPEDGHVALLRASLEQWMAEPERARLAERRFPTCARSPTPPRYPRGAGYGSSSACPSLDAVRRVAIDRATRFFAAEVHAARGRAREAAALRTLDALSTPDARARAARALEPWRSDEELRSAHALATSGASSSLEQLAAELGRLIAATVQAGADRARIVEAAIALLAELARPFTERPLAVRVEPVGDLDPASRRMLAVIARAASRCAAPEVHARLGPVAVTIAIVDRSQLLTRAPPALAECLEAAAGREARRLPAGAPIRARITVGPTGPLWGAPAELTSL